MLVALLLGSCASDRHFTYPDALSPGSIPRYLELQADASAGTVHFRRGLYSLGGADDTGYYYVSPRPVIKHSFAGFAQYNGGLFVRKGARADLRGYIVWAGGVTKVGNFSATPHAFRD